MTGSDGAMSGSLLQRLLHGGPRLTVGMLTADLLHLGDELAVAGGGRAWSSSTST